jgi:hypothetical protein
VLYHFEFRAETCWEAFGSGQGSGEDPIATAMADLTAVAGGTLPGGEYRYIEARSDSPRWASVWLGADRRILAAGDIAEPERLRRAT